MKLTKVFIIFGILLIVTLGQTEGRRRWFKRAGRKIGCVSRLQLGATIQAFSDDGSASDSDSPSGVVVSNNRKTNMWRKFKCDGNKCNRVTNTNSTNNVDSSNENVYPTNTTKVHRRTRINRKFVCGTPSNKSKVKNRTAVTLNQFDENGNQTRSDVGQHNVDGQKRRRHRHRNRRCRGRMARKGKCAYRQPLESPDDENDENDDWTDLDESNNELSNSTERLSRSHEPEANIL